jgi:N-acetylmuramoyl-L-alanine amidase
MSRLVRNFACGLFATAVSPALLWGQGMPTLRVERGDGSAETVAVQLDRGAAAVRLSVLEDLGWGVTEDEGTIVISAADEITVTMRLASPFFRWDGVVLQMTDAPYRSGPQTWIPLQFLTDFLPRRLPGLYEFSGGRSLLRAGDLSLLSDPESGIVEVDPMAPSEVQGASEGAPGVRGDDPAAVGGAMAGSGAAAVTGVTANSGAGGSGSDRGSTESVVSQSVETNSAEAVRNAGSSAYDGTRVVVIDAGHGGADPGALGPDDIREKNVALGVALLLAERLRTEPGIEVVMIRDDDTFVDIWDRGQIATEAKGEQPGIFVSIHANSFPERRAARGFETYFLSDARTEHERRVSAIENAPLSMTADNGDSEQMAEQESIFRDLKNFDHAHWSSDLAALVQDELGEFHPGPNRGVKQGVLAVLTNALMPSVLVELGYLSNGDEAALLATGNFHAASAEAIGDAVLRFFERYPPGTSFEGSREER